MKLIVTILVVCAFSQFASANNLLYIRRISPVACCEGRAEGGVRGTNTHTTIIVKACATSDTSYQDAQARACYKANRLADLALGMSMETKVPATIEGGH